MINEKNILEYYDEKEKWCVIYRRAVEIHDESLQILAIYYVNGFIHSRLFSSNVCVRCTFHTFIVRRHNLSSHSSGGWKKYTHSISPLCLCLPLHCIPRKPHAVHRTTQLCIRVSMYVCAFIVVSIEAIVIRHLMCLVRGWAFWFLNKTRRIFKLNCVFKILYW